MIKEALRYIVGLSDIKTIEHNYEVYADRHLHRVPNEIDCPDPLGSKYIIRLYGLCCIERGTCRRVHG